MDLAIHFVVAMADADGDNAAEEIEILIPVCIPDVLVLAARNHQRVFVVMKNGRIKVVSMSEQNLFFGHACYYTPTRYRRGHRDVIADPGPGRDRKVAG